MKQDMQQMPLDDDMGHGLGAGPGSTADGNSNSGNDDGTADNNADDSKGPAKLSSDVKMTRLAEFFRFLEYKPGVRPWTQPSWPTGFRRSDD